MIRAVIDTNVIVAAMLSTHVDSATVRTLHAIVDGKAEALVSAEILKEYREVLSRAKFGFSAERVSSVLTVFERLGKSVLPVNCDSPMPDEKDRVFYEVALAESDARLVTGNLKHYPVSPVIVTPAQFCELLDIFTGV